MLTPTTDGVTIAIDQETGAKLVRTRKQYVLTYGDKSRFWQRSKVHTDEDAIKHARKSLDKMLQSQEVGK